MLVEEKIQKILHQLSEENFAEVPFEGSDIFVRTVDGSSKLSLTTLVYDGGNYIPNSIRTCLSHKYPFSDSTILTFITVDEGKFQIRLNYLGDSNTLLHHDFKNLLEEFGLAAEKWRSYLDDHDKQDLVYVNVK